MAGIACTAIPSLLEILLRLSSAITKEAGGDGLCLILKREESISLPIMPRQAAEGVGLNKRLQLNGIVYSLCSYHLLLYNQALFNGSQGVRGEWEITEIINVVVAEKYILWLLLKPQYVQISQNKFLFSLSQHVNSSKISSSWSSLELWGWM